MPSTTARETGHRSADGGTYAPIGEHAAIGDGRTVALIDRSGRIDWLPLPDLDAMPIFAALIDAQEGGSISLEPVGDHEVSRRYLPGTNVLETTFTTAKGSVRVTDALVTGLAGRLPWAELARQVDGIDGSVTMRWSIVPGTALGTRSPWIDAHDDPDRFTIRAGDLSLGVVAHALGTPSVVTGADAADAVAGRFRTRAGSEHILIVAATDSEPLHFPHPEKTRTGVARTVESWRAWSREFSYDGPWKRQVQRSALALKLLIYSPTGAIAAAATTSLPESVGGGKNWDYRFAWIRDLAYTTGALVSFGLREETHAALSWLLRTIKRNGPELQIFYALDGSVDAETVEREAPGWRSIGPVVTGNPAHGQLQLGVYGDLFGIVRAYLGEGNALDVETGRFLADVADRVCDQWRSPDAGMWELTDERHYTSSKMACWQALDAAVWLAGEGAIVDRSERWAAERDRIHAWVGDHCWSEDRGAYVMHTDSDDLDTSVLLHAPSGFDRGERMASTIDAIRAELGRGDDRRLLLRYSGVEAEEHPFTACGFWMASALACVGRQSDAIELMDALVKDVNDVGLMAEMISATDGEFWGNFPQGLSHLALIDAAITIREMGSRS